MEIFSLNFLRSHLIINELRRGVHMSEVHIGDIPIPLVNYIRLIKYHKSPYYDIVQHILREMEMHHERTGRGSETVYVINSRVLQDEIEKRVQSEKLTTINICRTILALLYRSNLREEDDFYVTTTSRGRRNYHIKVNTRTLKSIHISFDAVLLNVNRWSTWHREPSS